MRLEPVWYLYPAQNRHAPRSSACPLIVKWSLAVDQKHGPHTGGGDRGRRLVTVNPLTGAVTVSFEYDTPEHFPPVGAAASGAQGSTA